MTERDVQNLVQADESALFFVEFFVTCAGVNRAAVSISDCILLVGIGKATPQRETG